MKNLNNIRLPKDIIINGVTLEEILKLHRLWLNDDISRVRANLRNANSEYANSEYAYSEHADLRYANLSYANLSYAKLNYAKLKYRI